MFDEDDNLWTKINYFNQKSVNKSICITTYVCNLPNGCILQTITEENGRSPATSMVHIPGLIYEENSFRSMTMEEMLGKEIGGMVGQMNSLSGILGKFGK